MVHNVGMTMAIDMLAVNPEKAGDLFTLINSIHIGLGGGNEIPGAMWTLLVSIIALKHHLLKKWVNIIGTIGLVPVDHETVEIIKLSISSGYTGKGLGEKMVKKVINEAYSMGFKTIILFTNRKLKAAISLYEKLGFKITDIELNSYEMADLKMIYNLE